MAENTSESESTRLPLYFATTGRSGIPIQNQLMNSALANPEDDKTRRRYEFQNDRPGSLGRAFEERSPWTVKLSSFSDYDDKKKHSAIVKEVRKSKERILKVQEHQLREALISRDDELPYRSIIDSEGKIVKNENLYNRDFINNYGKNYYTLQNIK